MRVALRSIICSLALGVTLAACVPPRPPRPPPLVELPPTEGTVLAVDVFRLPEGVEWMEIESVCAKGVRVPGDILLVDHRSEPGAADLPCFRVAWTNGLPQRWEGCGKIVNPESARHRRFELSGVLAARALVGADRSMYHGSRVLSEVEWHDEAIALTEREWVWCWTARGWCSPDQLLETAMTSLPPDRQVELHDSLTAEALEQGRRGAASGDGRARHHAAFKLSYLAKQVPSGATMTSFVRRVRDADVLDKKTYTKFIRALRPTLVAQRAYIEALEGDADPVGGFLDEAFWAGMVTGMAHAFPSALIPAPSTATAAQKWAIKEGAIEMMLEGRREDGLLLYEALVGAGRTADAERLKRELKKRYPLPPIPAGDSADEREMRRVLEEVLPPGDLDSRFSEADARARS